MRKELSIVRKRLAAIEWGTENRFKGDSLIMLLAEYLRRLALFTRAKGNKIAHPLFDPQETAGEKLDFDGTGLGDLSLDEGTYDKKAVLMVLKWYALMDSGSDFTVGGEDLFEPLLRFWERGGNLWLRHGELNCEAGSIPLKDWEARADMAQIDISPAALDSYDEQGKKRLRELA